MRAKALRAAEQTQAVQAKQAKQAKQAADNFRQLFNSDVGHLITVNVGSFRIETVKAKPALQHQRNVRQKFCVPLHLLYQRRNAALSLPG